jgi:hypothetical protein
VKIGRRTLQDCNRQQLPPPPTLACAIFFAARESESTEIGGTLRHIYRTSSRASLRTVQFPMSNSSYRKLVLPLEEVQYVRTYVQYSTVLYRRMSRITTTDTSPIERTMEASSQHHHHQRRWRERRSRDVERRGSNFDDYLDDEDHEDGRYVRPRTTEPCFVCNTVITAMCPLCSASHSRSYTVWKNWIVREQAEYQRRLGCTHWNALVWGAGVYVQRTCVVHPELLLIQRVQAFVGWAVHGLIFEFLDGTRTGYVVDVASIHDDDLLARKRSTEWQHIDMGDYVTAISGYQLSRGCFLCHTITLHLASGKSISFASQHEPWKGEPFDYKLTEDCLLHHVSFRKGRCIGVTAAETVMHLPVQSLQRVERLEKVHQDTFRLLQLVAQRIDNTRLEQGERPLGKDLWQTILCQFLVCRDLEPFACSPIGNMQSRRRALHC